MIKIFEKTTNSVGTLFINNEDFGKIRYEFTFNPYDTNNMKIKIFDSPINTKNFNSNITLIDENDFKKQRFYLRISKVSGGVFSPSDVEANVTEYFNEKKYYTDDLPSKIFASYSFPLISISDSHGANIKDDYYGIFHGDLRIKPPEAKLKKDFLKIKSHLGEFSISDRYDFYDDDSLENYSVTNVVRQSFCSISEINTTKDYSNRISMIQDHVNDLFYIISLVERTRVNWNSHSITLRTEENKLHSIMEIYRWVSPIHNKYRKNLNEQNRRQNSVILIFKVYEKISDEKKKVINKIINHFQVANCSRTLESKLIHWHSCLDFFLKNNKYKKKSFSQRLLALCNNYNIKINDLVNQDLVNNVENGRGVFGFTKLRNQYIHKGFDVFEGKYKEVIKEIEIMRAIGERLLLCYMEIDYKLTSLGEVALL